MSSKHHIKEIQLLKDDGESLAYFTVAATQQQKVQDMNETYLIVFVCIDDLYWSYILLNMGTIWIHSGYNVMTCTCDKMLS